MKKTKYTANETRYQQGMRYRRCGTSGVLIPEISLGLWHNFGKNDDYKKCKEIIHYAFDNGISHFDLANNYGPPPGSAEKTFGKILKQSLKPYRDELFISTKAGYGMWEGPYGEWGSRKYMLSSLDQSLKRMKLDYVDLFYSHRYDPETPLQETMQALVDAVRSGKVLYAGISNYPAKAAVLAYNYLKERDVPCLLHQGRYNMLDREAETEGLLDQAKENGVGYIVYSPLAQGLLTNKYLDGSIPDGSRMALNQFLKPEHLTEDVLKKLKKLNELAENKGQTLAQMALTWVLKDNKITSVIVGASSVEQLKQNIISINETSFSNPEIEIINELLIN